MNAPATYAVSIQTAHPRGLAAVTAQLPLARVSTTFATYLNQVYDAGGTGGTGAIRLDGQNVFVYRNAGDDADVTFAVGVAAAFSPIGAVRYTTLPAGTVATATHWGDYSRLGNAHAAIIEWCRANGHTLEGTRWEVYGHWTNDPAQLRTDVYYLLTPST